MNIAATIEIPDITTNMLKEFLGEPSPSIVVAITGPSAMLKNLAEFRNPMPVPFVPDLPPSRFGGIARAKFI